MPTPKYPPLTAVLVEGDAITAVINLWSWQSLSQQNLFLFLIPLRERRYITAKIRIKKRKATNLAYIEHTGDYGQIPFEEYMKKLMTWAKENKAKPGWKLTGIYYDDPMKTSPEQCRSEIGIPVRGNPPSGDEVKVKEIPGTEVATLYHKAPAEEYPNSYKTLFDWIAANDYELTGAPMEIYTKKPKVKGGKTIIYSEIQFPVKKK